MLSREKLADIVKDEVENKIRSGEIHAYYYNHYHILFNGKMYQADDYDKEVAKGKRSPNDIYAFADVYAICNPDKFLFHIDFLQDFAVKDVVEFYLRKSGFTIEHVYDLPPTPNLKYFIYTEVEFREDKPQYLGVSIYDIDSLARSFRIPQIVEQKLGNKPRKITNEDVNDISDILEYHQSLLAGYAYDTALSTLKDYYVNHKKKYKDEAYKVTLAYSQLFPSPYQVCYEWKAETFDKIDCLKLELLRFSS